ncbi:ammonia channel protein [Paenibacillus beijingensis]|uniref:Ammonium transporter n=1 Tax=Paenibacillus beijingensis TaxID=1126833 RepID=A0A0D5NQW5_9BACL|nr:ammonia channel protein [Paenibacillus beijingensis]
MVGLFFTFMFSFPAAAFAAGETPTIDSGDTAWLLVSTAIVIFMFLPGLALYYGGMVGQRNVLSVIMLNTSSMLIISVVWVLWGHSLAYGTDVGGWIGGLDYIGFNGVDQLPFGSLTIPHILFAVFQALFAAITVALIAGSVAERIRFSAWVLFAPIWVTLIYVPMAHWVWGGGWLSKIGGLDFAGGTVVHILSGVSALVAAIILGPRRTFPNRTSPPHNLVFFMIGAMCLWFGWMCFNGGSALSAGSLAGHVIATTQFAACAGGIVWGAMEWMLRKKATLFGTVTGIIAGLVAITPAAGYVSVLSSLVIGGGAGVVCYWAVNVLKSKLKYDDVLDVFGVHGIGGIWGALATGIFANKEINSAGNNGLLFGNPMQLVHQLIEIGVAVLLASVGTFVILKLIQSVMPIRVTEEEETNGLDISLHGEAAYNTFEAGRSEMVNPAIDQYEVNQPIANQTALGKNMIG